MCYNPAMNNSPWDLIVIGGGASGLMMAGVAGELGLSVLVLEKNAELGKKLKITGGGRCNIANAEFDTKKLLESYGDSAKFLHSPFSQFSTQESFDFFESQGLELDIQARKRAFPKSEKAIDVHRTLEKYCKKHGVKWKLNEAVVKIKTSEKEIVGVQTTKAVYPAKTIAIATGGLAAPETGSTGDGFRMLEQLGHSIYKPNPNIVPLTTSTDWIHGLSGTDWSFMKIKFIQDEKIQIRKTGKVLFTHFGISGPLILNTSKAVKDLLKNGPVEASIDLFPDTEENDLDRKTWRLFEKHKNKMIKNVLPEMLGNKMSDTLIKLSNINPDTKVHSVSKEERKLLTKHMKDLRFPIEGSLGWDKAVIADGGVPLEEVDTKTFASKKYPNLFLIGDTLHITRPSGGFSLQLCWTSGFVAAKGVYDFIKKNS